MRFGRIPVSAGMGAILAHSMKWSGFAVHKGEVIDKGHLAELKAAGVESIVGATLETGDVPENAAALRIAEKIAGRAVRVDRPFAGRCNIFTATAGLLQINSATIDAINAADEAITVATLAPLRPVAANDVIATVKIIPFAVPGFRLEHALGVAASGAVWISPFRPLRVASISTMLPGLKPSTISKTVRVLSNRLDSAGAAITVDVRVPHDVAPLAEAIRAIRDVDLIVIFGASATTDRRDVVPGAIDAIGGRVDHIGMPVDPGNLLLIGRVGDANEIPVLGAPGCARSPKENGFDFVLWRLLAGMPVSKADLCKMGVGGLLEQVDRGLRAS